MKRTIFCLMVSMVMLVGCCGSPPDGKTSNVVGVYFDGVNSPNYSVMIVDPKTKEATIKNLGTGCRIVMDVSPNEPMYYETVNGKHTIHVRTEGDITPGKVPGDDDNPPRKIQKVK